MKREEIKNAGRKPLPKGEKKIPLNAGYVKAKNKKLILAAIIPIIQRLDK